MAGKCHTVSPGKSVACKANQTVEDLLRSCGVNALLQSAFHKARTPHFHRTSTAFAAHGPAQTVCLACGKCTDRHRNFNHLILKDDCSGGFLKHRFEEWVVVDGLCGWIFALGFAQGNVLVSSLPMIGPGRMSAIWMARSCKLRGLTRLTSNTENLGA